MHFPEGVKPPENFHQSFEREHLMQVHWAKGSNLVNKMNEQMQWDIKVSRWEMHLKPNESFGYVLLQLL